MAKTLIVFASKQEFQFFFKNISSVVASSTPAMVNPSVDVAIAGVGIVDFSANLARFLSLKKYDRAFFFFFCGAYPNSGLLVGILSHGVPWSQRSLSTREPLSVICRCAFWMLLGLPGEQSTAAREPNTWAIVGKLFSRSKWRVWKAPHFLQYVRISAYPATSSAP